MKQIKSTKKELMNQLRKVGNIEKKYHAALEKIEKKEKQIKLVKEKLKEETERKIYIVRTYGDILRDQEQEGASGDQRG